MDVIESPDDSGDVVAVPVLTSSGRMWTSRAGIPVCVRPIRPDDLELACEFVAGLSSRSGYMRTMSNRCPTLTELQSWVNLDRRYAGAVIATVQDGERYWQIGVARYAIDRGAGYAEFAIVIADTWQKAGLGTQLMNYLVELARQSGVGRLFGTTFSENRPMIALAGNLGFTVAREKRDAAYTSMSLELTA